MNDHRFSLTDVELGLMPSPATERVSMVNRWVSKQAKEDPSPPEEIAKTFFADACRARLHIH